jgi:hypothetical protein
MGQAPSQVGLDYILSIIRLIRPSFDTHRHLVVEPPSYPIITDLEDWLRIDFILYIFTIPIVINNRHHNVSTMV